MNHNGSKYYYLPGQPEPITVKLSHVKLQYSPIININGDIYVNELI